jgi:hypothetical protein
MASARTMQKTAYTVGTCLPCDYIATVAARTPRKAACIAMFIGPFPSTALPIHVKIFYLTAVTILVYTIKLWYEHRLVRHKECGRKRQMP